MISNYAGSNNMAVSNKSWVLEGPADNSVILDGQNTYNGLFLSPIPEATHLDSNTGQPKPDIDTATYGKNYPYALDVTLKNLTIQNTTATGGDTGRDVSRGGAGGMLGGKGADYEWSGGGGISGSSFEHLTMGGAGFGKSLSYDDYDGIIGGKWDITAGISQTITPLPPSTSFSNGIYNEKGSDTNNSNGGIGGGAGMTYGPNLPLAYGSNGGFGGGGSCNLSTGTPASSTNMGNGGFGGGGSRTMVNYSNRGNIINCSNGGFGGGGGCSVFLGGTPGSITNSSNGGFGGGGGSNNLSSDSSNSNGGFGGGRGNNGSAGSGDGAGLGGAIFANVGVNLTLENVTLTQNNATGGSGNGGGAGLGGAVFIREGANFNVKGNFNIDNNTVVPGSGDYPGSAFGSGIFLQGSSGTTNSSNNITSTLTFSPNTGETQTLRDTIADQKGSVATETANWGIIKEGDGDLIILAPQSYSGDTLISAGTLQIGNGVTDGSIKGNIINDATLIFNPSTANTTYAKNISGNGAVRKDGVQTFIFTGSKTGSGITTINAGTFQIGNGITDGSIEGDIVNDATLVFNPNTAIATYTGNASGLGTLRKEGSQDLILTGSIDTDSVTINNGNLQIGNGGTTGSVNSNITLNGLTTTLSFDRADNVVHNSNISGTGSLVKKGANIVELNGNNSYTGPTTVSAGELRINTNLTSHVTVNSGAVLSGSGNIQNLINNGRVGAGTSTDNIQATSFNNANGTYNCGVTVGGASDQIQISDIATLGGTLNVIPLGGNYQKSQPYTYTILTAQNGFNNTRFANISSSPVYTFSVSYDTLSSPAQVLLTLIKKASLASLVPNGNENAIARNVDSVTSSTGTLKEAITKLTTIEETKALGQAINQFGNAINGSLQEELADNFFDLGNTLGSLLHSPLEDSPSSGKFEKLVATLMSPLKNTMAQLFSSSPRRYKTSHLFNAAPTQQSLPLSFKTKINESSVWVNNTFKSATQDAYNAPGSFLPKISLTASGTQMGCDHRFTDTFLLGITTSYFHTSYHLGQGYGRGHVNTYQVGLYGSVNLTPRLYVDFLGSYAYNRFKGTRLISFSNFGAQALQTHSANQGGTITETGYKVDLPYSMTLTPLAGLGVVYNKESKYTEQGAGTVGLTVKSQNRIYLQTKVGAQLAKHFKTTGIQFYGFVKLTYSQQKGTGNANKTTSSFIGQPTNFVVSSNNKVQKLVSPTIGLMSLWANNIYITVGYRGEFSKRREAHEGFLNFGKNF
jgi:autotransporter-associated beta strand protein